MEVKLITQKFKDSCIIGNTYHAINEYYIRGLHPRYDLEEVCDIWYMDNCHF